MGAVWYGGLWNGSCMEWELCGMRAVWNGDCVIRELYSTGAVCYVDSMQWSCMICEL
jgi:hypothetical protein